MKWMVGVLLSLAGCIAGGDGSLGQSARAERDQGEVENLQPFPDPSGQFATFSTNGKIDLRGPFFQSFGTNGRTCGSCHQPGDGWTIVPAHVQQRFEDSDGTDPIFRTNDGSNSPLADVSTVDARRQAYSMLLTKGLIRVGLPIPPSAEFELIAVDDPYGYASASELSLFRRPLPSTNLGFLATVMWDGREPNPALSGLGTSLAHQSNDATRGHAQAAQDLTAAQQQAIVAFELGLFTAQSVDASAGDLTRLGAAGGPEALANQPFFIGINDPLGGNPTGAQFDRNAMTIYVAWDDPESGPRPAARAAVARGETLFNNRPIAIVGVKGLNDELGATSIPGTCTTCHDTPNVGNHSVAAPLDLGLTDAKRRTPDLPLYTLRNKTTGISIQTTDPGRALITGRWKDIGRFKGPILRAVAARAPYFHNGSAASLADVVDFYDTRFAIGLSAQEKSDLVAFLRTL
ncbi:MAG TPA: hypothetical protein VKN99_23400 [Polyangia bacterium]|nr:hypothetical protein [Polyangia bacterium]